MVVDYDMSGYMKVVTESIEYCVCMYLWVDRGICAWEEISADGCEFDLSGWACGDGCWYMQCDSDDL